MSNDMLVVRLPRDVGDWFRKELYEELQYLASKPQNVSTQTITFNALKLMSAINEAAIPPAEGSMAQQILRGATALGDMMDAGDFNGLPQSVKNQLSDLLFRIMTWAIRARLTAIPNSAELQSSAPVILFPSPRQ